MCNLHWCYTFLYCVTLKLHCSQPIRIEWFFHVHYYNHSNWINSLTIQGQKNLVSVCNYHIIHNKCSLLYIWLNNTEVTHPIRSSIVLVLRGFLVTSWKDLGYFFEKQFFRTLASLSHIKIDSERASFGEKNPPVKYRCTRKTWKGMQR